MLNPSTADAVDNDPTLNRCIGFAKQWDCGAVELVNLFAYRSTDPKELLKVNDPVGVENNAYISKAAKDADIIVAAWGNNGKLNNRFADVMELLKGYKTNCLKLNRCGQPKHPLYVSSTVKLTDYSL